ncbi:MAG: hypothetical protein MUO67_22130 [Anaerolineales bacterium]|nr:hypothetical protein [Anaerolineales bacterium]
MRVECARIKSSAALWVTHLRFGSVCLGFDGLRAVLTRRANGTKVEATWGAVFADLLEQGLDSRSVRRSGTCSIR